MTKAELVEFVREKTGLRKVDAAASVAAVFEGVRDSLQKGDKVQLVGFGTFEVRERKARTGRNPQNPSKVVHIPAKTVPVFKAGKMLREAVGGTEEKAAKPAAKKAEHKAKKAAKK